MEDPMFWKTAPVLALFLGAACTADTPTANVHAATSHSTMARGIGELGPQVLSDLARVRQVVGRFHNVEAAKAAGYTIWSPDPAVTTCLSTSEGQMGYHLVNPSLRGSPANPAGADAVIDPLLPEMLLYEKKANGELRLVGVEYIVFKAAWDAQHTGKPTLFGQEFPLATHTFPPGTALVPHYELHVWLFAPNPLGTFYDWNPTVTC
jgi:hypothetical protein